MTSHTGCDRRPDLAGLTPGADIDHRGTPFTDPMLDALLHALRDPATGHAHLGDAKFSSATFKGGAEFRSATFERGAWFQSGSSKLSGAEVSAGSAGGDAACA
ncbi:pentapeptide repeat-containing protein [Streptomyces gibsoniae]|uniref:pentapeptide repeat-containing protein n=1 Tax=Streptomyces gibsoniae TaxID=3075529 RepID=UPI00374E14B0